MSSNLVLHNSPGFFIAIDGPNCVGKSTMIEDLKKRCSALGHEIYCTSEPTRTKLGSFIRISEENASGISLACLVAADRYAHIEKEILPHLAKGDLVITDRYILSSLILQRIDGVDCSFILDINSRILKPDLQIAIKASESTLAARKRMRGKLTRFERNYSAKDEIEYMNEGILELKYLDVDILEINNDTQKDLDCGLQTVLDFLGARWTNK